jgi:hypothetical protein
LDDLFAWERKLIICKTKIFIPIVLGFLFIGATLDGTGTDRENAGLIGPVRKVTVESGTWKEGSKVLTQSTTFDDKGNEIESIVSSYRVGGPTGEVKLRTVYKYVSKNRKEGLSYGEDGSITGKSVYTFDSKGKLIENLEYGPQGSVRYRIVQRYDDHERITESISFKPDGSVYSKSENTYDQGGNLKETISYEADKSIEYRVVYSHDGKGRMTESLMYKQDGVLDNKSTYAYNEKGLRTEKAIYNSDGILREKESYAYEFDSVGNWIKKTERKWLFKEGRLNAEPPHSVKRMIIYY